MLWAVLLLILSGCQPADVKVPVERVVDVYESPVATPSDPTIEQRVEARLEAMTLAEKVAQLFIVTPEALGGNTSKTAFDEALASGLGMYPVGGLIYFSGNIESPEQIQAMTGAVRTYADAHDCVPFFQSVDEEGGWSHELAITKPLTCPSLKTWRRLGQQAMSKRLSPWARRLVLI